MSIGPIDRYNAFGRMANKINSPRPIEAPSQQNQIQGAKSFEGVLGEVVKEVQEAQEVSNEMIENLMTGEKPVAVHEAMIALQKADVAFQLMNRVRTKLVRAYEEIMRTPV